MSEYYLEPNYDSAKSFYKKARVVEDGLKKTLYSYSTKVCEIDPKAELKANILGFYSQTTTRHIKDFLYQNGFKVGNKQYMYEHYTKRGIEELAEKEEKKAAREEARLKRLEIAEAKAQKKLERLEVQKEKLRKAISKELGESFNSDEIETLVLSELNS